MSEERKLILDMVKEGKISTEEALRLLDALGDKEKPVDDLEDSVKNIANKIISGVNKALKKTGETLSSIDMSDWNIDLGQNKVKTEQVIRTQVSDPARKILIENFNGRIHAYSWDNDYIETRALISYNPKDYDEDYAFIASKEEETYTRIGSTYKGISKAYVSNLSIAMPRTKFDDLAIKNTNGTIETSFIQAGTLNIENVNGAIKSTSCKFDEPSLETSQGSIEILDLEGHRLLAQTSNGSISAYDLAVEEVKARTVNGSINLGEIDKQVRDLDLSTVNGRISLAIGDFSRPIKISLRGRSRNEYEDLLGKFLKVSKEAGVTILQSNDFEEGLADSLEIKTSTVNGRTSIG